MEENLTRLNKENHLIKAELKALRGIMTNLQDPDYIQEILHNGSNR
jgi:cell division protein FtsB